MVERDQQGLWNGVLLLGMCPCSVSQIKCLSLVFWVIWSVSSHLWFFENLCLELVIVPFLGVPTLTRVKLLHWWDQGYVKSSNENLSEREELLIQMQWPFERGMYLGRQATSWGSRHHAICTHIEAHVRMNTCLCVHTQNVDSLGLWSQEGHQILPPSHFCLQ